MIARCRTMYEVFCEMFPSFKDKVIKYDLSKNGAGIMITLDNGNSLQFSYLDEKTWWLRTT